MKKFITHAKAAVHCSDGPTATEYAVVVALIITACLTAVGGIGAQATTVFNTLQTALTL